MIRKNIYKKLFGIGMAAATLLSVSSCNEFLTQTPKNKYDYQSYFTGVNNYRMAVDGISDAIAIIEVYGQYMMAVDCDTDISFMNGADSDNTRRDIAHYMSKTENAWLEVIWQNFYVGINRANVVIENKDAYKPANQNEADLIKSYIGEAKFMRALMYFELVRYFGEVPLKLTASDVSQDFKQPRADREALYRQIIQDLKDASQVLPWHNDPGYTFLGRPTKGAALGLLARANLYRGGYFLAQDGTITRDANYLEYYQAAKDACAQVISSGKHELNASYETIFRNYCETKAEPQENIYAIDFFNETGAKLHSGTYGTWNGPLIDAKSTFGRANNFIRIVGLFYDRFDTGDLRRAVAIGDWQIDKNNNIKPIARAKSPTWGVGKWRRNWQSAPIKDQNNTEVDAPILRYSDILLMYAEAENELEGPKSNGVEYLNMIRRRAFGKPVSTADPSVDKTFSDKDAMFQYICDERARELCFEGLRKTDLVRWNILGKTLRDTRAAIDAEQLANPTYDKFIFTASDNFKDNQHELFPVPARERRENPNLSQNPGYPL